MSDVHPTIRSAVEQLAALTGAIPRVVAEPDAVRVEVAVTDEAVRHWQQLLAVLETGTRFGLKDTAAGQVAWLRYEEQTDAGS